MEVFAAQSPNNLTFWGQILDQIVYPYALFLSALSFTNTQNRNAWGRYSNILLSFHMSSIGVLIVCKTLWVISHAILVLTLPLKRIM